MLVGRRWHGVHGHCVGRVKSRLRSQLTNHVGQRGAVDQLHGIVVHATVAAHTVDRHDPRVMQHRGGLRFVLEPS